MADLKYYSLSLVFHSFSFLSFFSAVCRTRHLTRDSRLLELKPGFTGNQESLFGYRYCRSLSGSSVS